MKRIVLAIFVMVVLVASSLGQQRGDATYKLRPDDIIRIQVFNQQQIGADVPVGEDGNISAPFVGILKAQGKTTAELEQELYQLYVKKLKLRDPVVSVTITRYRIQQASVTGFVNSPGVYQIRPGDTIMTLVSQGRGFIPNSADLRRATLRRRNSKELIPIDLFAMLIKGDVSQNYELEDGDELNVPEETRNRIVVLGAVRQPGIFPYREPMTIAEAIGLAGGEIRYVTRFSKVRVIREQPGRPGKYIEIPVDFVKFVKQSDYTQNIELRPGDMVYIPETNNPDYQQINSLVNTAFILNTFGSLFGLRIFN